jgi:hypothetical protein
MSGISTITAPVYGRDRDSVYGGAQSIINRESTTIRQNALIPRSHSPGPIQEPVIEHEHHHVHHHIDHGSVSSVMGRRTKDYYDDNVSVYERDSRRSSVTSLGGTRRHRRRHRHRDSDGITRQYTHTEIDVRDDLTSVSRNNIRRDYDEESSVSRSRRYDDNQSDWTLIDVPPGTRKITLEADERGFSGPDVSSATNMRMMGLNASESQTSISRSRGVRRSKGSSTELWTEVTKDLITRDAIEEMGYPYEETDSFYYIFEYLQKDQIDELIEITAEIRHERVRELDFKRRLELVDARDARDSRSSFGNDERILERERIHDHVTEVVYADEHPRRRRGRYYH